LWFAPIFVGGCAAAGSLWFLATDMTNPVDVLDFNFYRCLFISIGAVTGMASWLIARIVAGRRCSIPAIAAVVIPACVFISLLAFDKNPPIAIVATVAFAFIFVVALLSERSTRPTRDN
jgi:hypothetical protein